MLPFMGIALMLTCAAAWLADRSLAGGWRGRVWVMMATGAACIAAAALAFLMPSGGVFQILPPTPALPFYALLRVVPDKAGGVIAAFAFPGLIGLWFWTLGSNTSRVLSPLGLVLAGLFVATFAGLFASGLHLPDDPLFPGPSDPYGSGTGLNSWLWFTRALALYGFGYLAWALFFPGDRGHAPPDQDALPAREPS